MICLILWGFYSLVDTQTTMGTSTEMSDTFFENYK